MTDLFQLLVDTRAQVDSNIAAIEAYRDFFIAASDLSAAISGGGKGDTGTGATSARAAESNARANSD